MNFMAWRVEGTDLNMLQIVNRCSPTVTQIGCASRVWQVSLVPNVRFNESYTKPGREGGHTSRRR